MEKLNSVLQENITGARVVKAFSRKNFETEKYHKVNTEFLQEIWK